MIIIVIIIGRGVLSFDMHALAAVVLFEMVGNGLNIAVNEA